MRKWTKLILCGVLAVAVVTATELALDFFETSDFSLGAVEPERCEIISAGGAAREVEADIELIPWDWQEGESFRLTWHLPTTDELPELYDDGYIYLAPCASEFIFYIEGDEAFRVANHDDQLSLALAETFRPSLPALLSVATTVRRMSPYCVVVPPPPELLSVRLNVYVPGL